MLYGDNYIGNGIFIEETTLDRGAEDECSMEKYQKRKVDVNKNKLPISLFRSEADCYIFYLLFYKGEDRNTFLNITEDEYEDINKAFKWRKDIEYRIKEGHCVERDKALDVINNIFRTMVHSDKDFKMKKK